MTIMDFAAEQAALEASRSAIENEYKDWYIIRIWEQGTSGDLWDLRYLCQQLHAMRMILPRGEMQEEMDFLYDIAWIIRLGGQGMIEKEELAS